MTSTRARHVVTLLLVAMPAARGAIIYGPGTYMGGNYDVISQVAGVIDLEGGATLNAQPGGSILGPNAQRAYGIELNSGQVNNYGALIAGGSYTNNWAYGITVSGGTVNLYSGSVAGGKGTWADAVSVNAGTVNVFGGTISGGRGVLDGSGISVNGGLVNIYGGTFQAGSANVAYGLDVNGGAVYIYGSQFNCPLGPLAASPGILTGTLADGTPLNLSVSETISGAIVLVPEPSAAVLLAVGLVASVLRNQQKKDAVERLICTDTR